MKTQDFFFIIIDENEDEVNVIYILMPVSDNLAFRFMNHAD